MNFSPLIQRIIHDLAWKYVRDSAHIPKGRHYRVTKSNKFKYKTIEKDYLSHSDVKTLFRPQKIRNIEHLKSNYAGFISTIPSDISDETRENLIQSVMSVDTFFKEKFDLSFANTISCEDLDPVQAMIYVPLDAGFGFSGGNIKINNKFLHTIGNDNLRPDLRLDETREILLKWPPEGYPENLLYLHQKYCDRPNVYMDVPKDNIIMASLIHEYAHAILHQYELGGVWEDLLTHSGTDIGDKLQVSEYAGLNLDVQDTFAEIASAIYANKHVPENLYRAFITTVRKI